MSGPTPGGLFEAPPRPVELPSEGAARSVRRALMSVALAVLVGGVLSGFLYHRFWKTVSHEVPWLLPASTQFYARIPRPYESLLAAAALPQWADPPGVRRRLAEGGLLRDLAPKEVAGVPTGALWGLLREARELQVALVPSPEGYGLLLFARMAGADSLRGASRALQAGMPVVDRVLGFAIHAATQPALRSPWGEPAVRLRYVEMPPFILLSLGPEAPLRDVLQAKVSGTSQPVRTREGFQPLPSLATRAGVSAFLDPGPLFDALHAVVAGAREPRADEGLRMAIVQRVLGLLLKSEVRSDGEALRVVAHLRDPQPLQALHGVVRRAPRSLLDRAPADADLVVSLGVASLAAVPEALASILGAHAPWAEAARRALPPHVTGASLALGPAVLWTSAAGLGLVIPAGAASEPARWILEIAPPTRAGGPEALAGIARRVAAQPTAHGTIYAESLGEPSPGGAPLHVLAAADRPSRVYLAWRQAGDVIDAAASWEALRAFGEARAHEGTLGGRHLVERAARTLPADASAIVLAHPRLLRGLGFGAGAALTDRLRASTRLGAAVTLAPSAGSLALHLNIGPLSVVTAALTARRDQLDRALLPALPGPCLEAVERLCARAAASVPCEPWQPRRKSLISNACRRALLPSAR